MFLFNFYRCEKEPFIDQEKTVFDTTRTLYENYNSGWGRWTKVDCHGNKNLHIPTWSTPSDFVVFAAVRYTNVQGRSYGTPDYKVSSPMAINTTVFK